MLVNRPLQPRKHVRLGALQILNPSVDKLQLVRQLHQPVLLALLHGENLELVVEVLRMLQRLVTIPDAFSLLVLLNQVPVFFFVSHVLHVSAFFQLLLFFLLSLPQLEVGLLQLHGEPSLSVILALGLLRLDLVLLLFFDLFQNELFPLPLLSDLILTALLASCLVDLLRQFPLLILQVLHPRHDLFLVLFRLQQSELRAALRALVRQRVLGEVSARG